MQTAAESPQTTGMARVLTHSAPACVGILRRLRTKVPPLCPPCSDASTDMFFFHNDYILLTGNPRKATRLSTSSMSVVTSTPRTFSFLPRFFTRPRGCDRHSHHRLRAVVGMSAMCLVCLCVPQIIRHRAICRAAPPTRWGHRRTPLLTLRARGPPLQPLQALQLQRQMLV